jgi:pyruvate kinase
MRLATNLFGHSRSASANLRPLHAGRFGGCAPTPRVGYDDATGRGIMFDSTEHSPGFDGQDLDGVLHELTLLEARILEVEDERAAALRGLTGAPRASARNLLHYLALRQHDIRPLQERLARLGLSSLGRAEAHVLGNLHAVARVVAALAGRGAEVQPRDVEVPAFGAGHRLLEERTAALLGAPAAARSGRICVTMPREAAHDDDFVRACLASGMDCMRINCAHDDEAIWERMIVSLRGAERETGRACRVLMDLAGPKLRTGRIEPGPAVVHWKPVRDENGRLRGPARIWLTPRERPEACPPEATAALPVPQRWLERLVAGDDVRFTDARGAQRRLRIGLAAGRSRWAESEQTAYVIPATELRVRRRRGFGAGSATVHDLPRLPGTILLRPGDPLVLTREGLTGTGIERDVDGRVVRPAMIACTLSEVFAAARPDERIWIDDGKIGGVIRHIEPGAIHITITHAKPSGSKLHADRGINFPDSDLQLPALTNRDLADLPFVARHADLVGLSYVQCPEDIRELQSRLKSLGAPHLGIVLKIETHRAFERLPELILAALRSSVTGVMIARGDLAVECGWERLAEMQEEMLWICEAAHMPVIWATQVLESLAKNGLPSRAEITDAAMSGRAECVMLNKGAHVVEAIRVLDSILQRMQGHQRKKSPRLGRLRSWTGWESARVERRFQPFETPSRSGAVAGGVEALSGTSSMLPSSS